MIPRIAVGYTIIAQSTEEENGKKRKRGRERDKNGKKLE